jgi:hypothetical protein
MAYTTIKKPSDYFNTKLYTGDGSSSRSITGVGFQPDWVWFKQRSGTQSHTAIDAVRTGDSKIRINSTSAEFTGQSYNFNSDGFGWTTQDDESNQNGSTYASWNWKANGAGSTNTVGDLTATVSVNTTSGFSIVSYTGNGTSSTTIGHGLGVKPAMIIVKKLNGSYNWGIYHKDIGATKVLAFTTGTPDEDTSYWNDVEPTSSVFYVGNGALTNGSGSDMIAYCFAEKQGFSKFGSYAGNQNNDGTFVYLGFKPAFVMVKRYSAGNPTATNWVILDNKRDTENTVDKWLYPNANDSEYTSSSGETDFVSNGFKIRGTGSYYNDSGHNYIYMAFAEQPLVGDNPATAR